MMVFKETTEYENLMDLMEETITDPETLFKQDAARTMPKDPDGIWKSIYIHFRDEDGAREFANLIEHELDINVDVLVYPRKKSLFEQPREDYWASVDRIKRIKTTLKTKYDPYEYNWRKYWINMPEYDNPEKKPFHSMTIKFRNEEDYRSFANKIQQNLTEKTKSIWHPGLDIQDIKGQRWIEQGGYTQPTYPLCTISKGRADSMLTSRSLSRMHIHHYIAVEPQDIEAYEAALIKFNLSEFATILELPFSNHGDGPGRARNWWWDYSRDVLGAEKHWVMDDNIVDFYRFQHNKRIRVESGALFKSCEDFMDRFENVLMAGLQYRFFIAPNQEYPAFVKNTRIYSCNLIDNACPWRWRGRYNEDTILSLDILDNGYCTIQFNHFLQGKAATQTVGGGNTAEFYHAEGDKDKEAWREGRMNATGTINKSQMLVEAYPQYSELAWRYGRWHHYVDYSPFKKTQLIYKNPCREIDLGHRIPPGINNYGLELMRFDDQGQSEE